jgi:hypothetical protein
LYHSTPAASPPENVNTSPEIARLQALQQMALEHLGRGRADLARPLVEELRRAAPAHPQAQATVRQMMLYVEAIAVQWPAQREPYTPTAREAPHAGLDIVSFHVDLPRAPSGIHGQIDYASVLALSFESARLRAPHARTLLLTDEATRVPEGIDEVVREPIDRNRLMYERMRVQSRFLQRRDPGRATVFTDSDVVVNLDPAPIFAEDFDVGLTWRTGLPDAPFNGGMIFVAPGEAGARFFAEAIRCYDALADDAARKAVFPQDLRAWWGDQFALAAMVGYREFGERTGEGIRVNGVRVRFFPCETHNFTMEGGNHEVAALRRKYFIHFKGNRKAMQGQYLDAMRSGRL